MCALAYVARNQRFTAYRSIGVKRLPEGAAVYEFKGEWRQQSLTVKDDQYNRIIGRTFYEKPYGVAVDWRGQNRSQKLTVKIPLDSSRFSGRDGESYPFEGSYYPPSDTVEIRDRSQNKYKYAYRILW